MFQLHRVVLLCLLKLVSGLTEMEKLCIANNPGSLNNDYLIGEWYEVYIFSSSLNLERITSCTGINITIPTADDLEGYKSAYGEGEPYQFDDNAVLIEGEYKGMLTGGEQVKIFAIDPSSVLFGSQPYEARVYKMIDEDYMLFNTCSVELTKWLLSRNRNSSDEELKRIIRKIDEVRSFDMERLICNLESHNI